MSLFGKGGLKGNDDRNDDETDDKPRIWIQKGKGHFAGSDSASTPSLPLEFEDEVEDEEE